MKAIVILVKRSLVVQFTAVFLALRKSRSTRWKSARIQKALVSALDRGKIRLACTSTGRSRILDCARGTGLVQFRILQKKYSSLGIKCYCIFYSFNSFPSHRDYPSYCNFANTFTSITHGCTVCPA